MNEHRHRHTSNCINYDELVKDVKDELKEMAIDFNMSYKEMRKTMIKALIKAKDEN